MEARERIARAALRLFADRGYDGVGVQEVVAAAEVTKPTLYHHFGNKRGLLVDICDRIKAGIGEATQFAGEYSGDLPQTLQRTVAAFFGFAARRPEELRLLVVLSHSPVRSEAREVVQSLEEALIDRFEQLFVRAAADHGNMRGQQTELAQTLVATLNWYALRIADGEIESSEELAFRVMHRFSHGIYS